MAEFIGEQPPTGIDGISVLPEILGNDMLPGNRFMYWEFHEGDFFQAVRWKDWKAVRKGLEGPLELYDLSIDPSETTDRILDFPEVRETILHYLDTARTESDYWIAR